MNEIEIKKKILSRCVRNENGCLVWQGAKACGYASMTIDQKRYLGHRLILKFKNGKWPFVVDHICKNRACLNEDHLRDVDYSENNKGIKRKSISCRKGHLLTSDNINSQGRCKHCINTNQTYRRTGHV